MVYTMDRSSPPAKQQLSVSKSAVLATYLVAANVPIGMPSKLASASIIARVHHCPGGVSVPDSNPDSGDAKGFMRVCSKRVEVNALLRDTACTQISVFYSDSVSA